MEITFQSHAGSIEACVRCCIQEVLKVSFNPTLVRLRRLLRLRHVNPQQQFQSHAGSIEAPDRAPVPVFEADVSIPRWFD